MFEDPIVRMHLNLANDLRQTATEVNSFSSMIGSSIMSLAGKVQNNASVEGSFRTQAILTGDSQEARNYNFFRMMNNLPSVDFSYTCPYEGHDKGLQALLLEDNGEVFSMWTWLAINEKQFTYETMHGFKTLTISKGKSTQIKLIYGDKLFNTEVHLYPGVVNSETVVIYNFTEGHIRYQFQPPSNLLSILKEAFLVSIPELEGMTFKLTTEEELQLQLKAVLNEISGTEDGTLSKEKFYFSSGESNHIYSKVLDKPFYIGDLSTYGDPYVITITQPLKSARSVLWGNLNKDEPMLPNHLTDVIVANFKEYLESHIKLPNA